MICCLHLKKRQTQYRKLSLIFNLEKEQEDNIMQSIGTKGQLKVAAAQHPKESRYWRDQLSGDWDRTGFPFDYPSNAAAIFQFFRIELETAISSKLLSVCKGKHVTLQVYMTAAVMALLHRYTGVSDMAVGVPSSVEGKSKALTQALAVRVAVDADSPFRKLLDAVKEATFEAIANQNYPIELLAEELGFAETKGAAAFFGTAVEVRKANQPSMVERVPTDIVFGVEVADSMNMRLILTYDANKYQRATIHWIGGHLEKLLKAVLANPNGQWADIDIFTLMDREVCDRANATEAFYEADLRIDQVFKRQVDATPEAVAVVADGVRMSYADLDAKANQLSHTLRDRGLQANQLVAVIVERSPEMLVAILAILKAGGGYLPIDPGYPRSRIQFVLDDSGAQIVLAHRHLIPALNVSQQVLDMDDPEIYVPSTTCPEQNAGARDIAYVIYTSGSTGKPKGVLIEHHSVINRIAWMQKAYPINSNDVILQKTPISFDVSVWELFWWFFEGASVCLMQPEGHRDPEAIITAVEMHRVTTMHFVPSMLNAFLDYVGIDNAPNRLKTLRQVFASGEALLPNQVNAFGKLLTEKNDTQLINLYGPTEATVDVTHYLCTNRGEKLRRVPIGRPIDNTRLYVVDKQLRPQPIGVQGELGIAGVGLARGYHNRPELTARCFVDHPFDGEQRIYRTGDLARWLPDGQIEYLGRIDHQVKVRGYRIELPEIETCLRQHPDIRDAVVTALRINDGHTHLVGYLIADKEIDEDALRRHLGQTLPEYMIPSYLLRLKAFPLSPNGKLDRRALPAPKLERHSDADYIAPRTETEATLAEIWELVLHRERIGVHDNFFALGGTSIHFVTVLARARKHGLNFTFQNLFAYPTIDALAKHIESKEENDIVVYKKYEPFEMLSTKDRLRIPDGVEDAYPLSMLQAGLIFQNEMTYGTAQYHDIMSYIIQSPIDTEKFNEATRILVQRNPIFRTSYQLFGFDEYIQMVHREVDLPLFISDLRHLDESEQNAWYENWLISEKAHRFFWQRPELVRLHVHILRDNLFRYTLSQHNSALDGWSISLVHTQLFKIYYRLLSDEKYNEPLVDNHLRNYVGIEQESLNDDREKQFWLTMLDGAPFTQIPRWQPEKNDEEFTVVFHDVDISKQLSDRLLSLADRLSVPLKSILMAAHLKVLGLVSGDSDVMTGYEHSGRPETEDAIEAIGLFLNTVPFRVCLSDGTWEELIQQVYRAETEMLPHRRYPMAKMKQDLNTQDLLFETVFNFTHFYLMKELKKLPEFSLLDIRVNTETEFVLRAEFSRHFYKDHVCLSLHYHKNVFPPEQIELLGKYYVEVFKAMTEKPQTMHCTHVFADHEEHNCTIESLEIEALRNQAGGEIQLPKTTSEFYLLSENLLPVPVGTRGYVYYAEQETASARRWEHPFIAGQYIVRTGIAARRLPNLKIEYMGSADSLHQKVFSLQNKSTVKVASTMMTDDRRTPPSTDIECLIAEAWSHILGIPNEDIALEDNFFDLGGNSLAAMRVVLRLKKQISLVDLMKNSTLGPLARIAEERDIQNRNRLLQRISKDHIKQDFSVICFPYAAGNAINFQPLAEAFENMRANIAVYAVELTRTDSSGIVTDYLDVPRIAEALLKEIPQKISGPIILWGHCVGTALALETAYRLAQRANDILHVFLGGKLMRDENSTREIISNIKSMSYEQILCWLVEETGYSELGDLDANTANTIASAFRYDAWGANLYLANAYKVWLKRKLQVPVTAVVAKDDYLTRDYCREYERWSLFAKTLSLREIEQGGHYFCQTQTRHVAELIMDECRKRMAA
jgi:amino acid adenylation domain-containing protein